MILELYQTEKMRSWTGYTAPYRLFEVKNISKVDEVTFNIIEIFNAQSYATDVFEYVKDIISGKVFVEHGKWVGDE